MVRLNCILGTLVALLLPAASLAAPSFEEACNALPAAPLIRVATRPVTVVNAVAEGDMQSMTIRTTGSASLQELATVGTTRANHVWELSYGMSMASDRATGRVCYRPVIHVAIGYDPMQISVANAFRSGTCAHDVIVEHELGHVKIYDEFLPVAASAIEQRVRERLSRRVRYADSVDAANADMKRMLRSDVAGVVRAEMAKSDSLHARFDSIEESLQMLNSCDGEIRRGLRSEVLAWK